MSHAVKSFRMALLPTMAVIALAFGGSQALAAPQDGPAGSSRAARYCLPGDVTADCPIGIWCYDGYGRTCGG